MDESMDEQRIEASMKMLEGVQQMAELLDTLRSTLLAKGWDDDHAQQAASMMLHDTMAIGVAQVQLDIAKIQAQGRSR